MALEGSLFWTYLFKRKRGTTILERATSCVSCRTRVTVGQCQNTTEFEIESVVLETV
jgi:hypothetical protein